MPASTTDTITQGYGSIHKGRSTVRANLINHTVSSSHKNQPTVYAASPPVEPADTSSPVNFEEPQSRGQNARDRRQPGPKIRKLVPTTESTAPERSASSWS